MCDLGIICAVDTMGRDSDRCDTIPGIVESDPPCGQRNLSCFDYRAGCDHTRVLCSVVITQEFIVCRT